MNHYKRHYFILTDKDVFPAVLHSSYEAWKNKVTEREYAAVLSELDKKKIKIAVKVLAEKIRDTKKQMLEDSYS
jgi:hypothetical protein